MTGSRSATATPLCSDMKNSDVPPARQITILSACAAILFVSQVAMAALPNIELVSLLVVLYTSAFRKRALFPIYVFVFLEGILYGFHLWWVIYLYIWLILWGTAMLMGRRSRSPVQWALVTGIFGLLFGFFGSFAYLPVSGVRAAAAWWIAGIPMDLIHGAGNFVLTLVLFRPLGKVLSHWAF